MKKFLTILLTIFPLAANSFEIPSCSKGTELISGKRMLEGKQTTAYGCVNKKGNPHGLSIVIYKKTVIDKCNYNNGLEHGLCESWYFTGEKKAVSTFKYGKLHGKTTYWHKNGSIKFEAFHNNGKLDCQK